jgi:general secretion pathway protein A
VYLDFYHLNREPFRITPDPEFLYWSPSHKEALAAIAYGVEKRKGIIAVTGEVGTGKTTILRTLLGNADPNRFKSAYVFNPAVSFPVLLQTIFQELGISPESGETSGMVDRFHQYLIEEYKKDNTVALFIDEAQNMPVETLENLRMLSNLESSTDKLLQIVLCGQPELEQVLGRNELRQLKSRIAVRATISLLSRQESLAYIRHRLSKSSRIEPDIFTKAALERIIRKAKGNPRSINILCDNALITGFGSGKKKVTFRTAGEIIADMEGSPASGIPQWAIASIGLLFFLGVGYWIYSTNASHTLSVVAKKPVPPVLPAQPSNNPAAIRLESQVSSAPGHSSVPAGQGEPAEGNKLQEATPEVKNEISPVTRVVKKGDNLSRLVEDVYGYSNREVLDRVKQQNRGIKDINRIQPGKKIIFPPMEE